MTLLMASAICATQVSSGLGGSWPPPASGGSSLRSGVASLVRARLFSDGKKMSWMGGPARGRAPAGDDSGCGYAQHGDGTRAGGPSRVPRQNVARGDTRVSKHDERATCEVARDTVRLHLATDSMERTMGRVTDYFLRLLLR